jgi:hypothetical protein
MAKFRIEVDAPKPVEVKVNSIAELDAAVAKVVRTMTRAVVFQKPLDHAAEKMLAADERSLN